MHLIKPKPLTVEDMDGNPISVILHRLPATVGREISVKYPMSNMPKIGDYEVSEETMLKLMSYVAVPSPTEGAETIILKTKALIENHIPDAETLLKIEMAMLEYNFSFFRKGRISNLLNEFVQMVIQKITETSIQSSGQ